MLDEFTQNMIGVFVLFFSYGLLRWCLLKSAIPYLLIGLLGQLGIIIYKISSCPKTWCSDLLHSVSDSFIPVMYNWLIFYLFLSGAIFFWGLLRLILKTKSKRFFICSTMLFLSVFLFFGISAYLYPGFDGNQQKIIVPPLPPTT